MKARRDIGGMARRAALAQKIRAEQNGRGIPVWLVDVGDFSDGTPFSTEYMGEADVAAREDTGRTRLEVLTAYLKTKGTLAPAYDGRRVVIGGRNRSGG